MMRQVMKTKNNSLTIIHREFNQAMKNVAFNYKITAYQRKRRVSYLKAVHFKQFKSTKHKSECISSVYKGSTICRLPSFLHGSCVISFSENHFLR